MAVEYARKLNSAPVVNGQREGQYFIAVITRICPISLLEPRGEELQIM